MPPAKRHKGNDTHKPPSADELSKYRDVQFLQHSNLFRLQIDEMLSTLGIKPKTKVRINSWLAEFKSFLKTLPTSKKFQFSNPKWMEDEGIDVPLKVFPEVHRVSGVFTFFAPEEVRLVGSFPLDLATTHSPVIDVALVVPKEFMQTNDLFNGKWLLRRALYLSWIGKALRGSEDLVTSVSWTRHCGSHLRPTLQVTPKGKLGNLWKINLYPVPPEGHFKAGLVSPINNNVSPSWFFDTKEKDTDLSPTPHHNWLCGVDVVMLSHHSVIKERLQHPNWIQGLKLLKIWLNQRNLNKGEGGISSHLMTLLVVHLSQNRKLSAQMSPYQVFRTALLHLSQTDWRVEGPSLFDEKSVTDRNLVILTPADFHSVYPVVFVDTSGCVNIAGNVLTQGYLQLQHEANTGLEILELSSTNSFDSLFIQKSEFHLCFDQIVQLRFDLDIVSKIFEDSEGDGDSTRVDRLGDLRVPVFARVISTLSQGLGDRTDLIGVMRRKTPVWSYGGEAPDLNCNLTLGILVHPRKGTALMTKGPSAETKEAAEFHQFWGDVCSLRRFKDSTFHEAVLWLENDDPEGERRLIVGKVVAHLMEKEFKLPRKSIHYVARQLEDVLRLSFRDGNYKETFKYGTGEEVNRLAILSFDSLSRKLRSLDLPLKITSIQSSSDVLKHSEVFPPMAVRVPRPYVTKTNTQKTHLYTLLPGPYKQCPLYRTSIEVQVFLEISGKWPDDLVAIKAVKVEFMIKMAELLRNEGITAVVFPSYLQLIWEGYLFRVKVCYRREIYLLRLPSTDEIDDDSTELDTEASIELEKEIEILPKLTSALNSFQSEFPSFSGAIRLIRRWVSAQLLSPHFPPIVVDLLVAYLYLCSYPYKAPNTPHVALLRFMSLMAKTDWKSTPFFVNLRSQFNATDENELTKRFTAHRADLPPLYICSSCELRPLTGNAEPTVDDLDKRYKLSSCWSKTDPTLPILSRMKVVAGAALKTMSNKMWKKAFDFTILFRPPLTDYDVLIFLLMKQTSRGVERIGSKVTFPFQPYEHTQGEKLPPVEFDPVQSYLKELRAAYDSHALFFNDQHGGGVIGVAWKPQVFDAKEAKVASFEGHKLVGIKEVKQIVNVDAILEEFRILGKGIVKEIKIKS